MRVKTGRVWVDYGPGNGTAGADTGYDTNGTPMNAAGTSPGMIEPGRAIEDRRAGGLLLDLLSDRGLTELESRATVVVHSETGGAE